MIVSDYKMPGGDGLALLIEVKKRHPGVIRVLMTAYADMHSVIRAMNEGEIHRPLVHSRIYLLRLPPDSRGMHVLEIRIAVGIAVHRTNVCPTAGPLVSTE